MRKAVILLTFYCLLGNLAGADSDWWGLWRVHLVRQNKIAQTHHLKFGPGGPLLLRESFLSNGAVLPPAEAVETNEESGALKIRMTSADSQSLSLTLSRQGRTLRGEWSSRSSPFSPSVDGTALGYQITESEEWEPWSALDSLRESGVLDLAAILSSKAPLDQYRNFDRFWSQQLEPAYYFILGNWLYGAQPDPNRSRQSQLRRLFDLLQSPSTRESLLGSSENVARVRNLISQIQDPAEAASTLLVRLPGFDVADVFLQAGGQDSGSTIHVAFLNPFRYGAGPEGQVMAERDNLARLLWKDEPGSIAISVYRESLVLQMAIENLQVDWPIDSGAVEAARFELGQLLLKPPASWAQNPQLLSRSLTLALGLGLARSLRAKHDFPELLRWSPEQIMNCWEQFLHAGQVEGR